MMPAQKKILLLGGLRYLLPVIEEAHKMGVYVITADYLPDNIAHKYSDAYCNVSITDKEAVLAEAKRLQIDGILSFAVDPGVVSAAYVAEKMGLPFQCSYEAASILQNKMLFREYLQQHGFPCPWHYGFSSVEQVLVREAEFSYPLIVKPTDSAGSKGVSRVNKKEELRTAAELAFKNSISGGCIVEQFLETVGFQSSADVFTQDGKLVYSTYSDQAFDKKATNPYTPAIEIWPSSMSQTYQQNLDEQLQRLFDLLQVKTGIYNVEARVCPDGRAYIMEVSPRGGGNRIAELQSLATKQNLIKAEIQKALCMLVEPLTMPQFEGVWCNYILHSYEEGAFERIEIEEDFQRQHVVDMGLTVEAGDRVRTFTGANTSLGTLFLHFDSREQLEGCMQEIGRYIRIVLQ